MAAIETFSRRLKELRGKIAVKDLARSTGISTTVLYKAESGDDTVSWKTIEAGYGHLCRNQEAYAELLMLWATTQSQRPVALYHAKEALDSVLKEEAREMSAETLATVKQMELMPVTEQRRFARLAGHYRKSETTRKMADVWMESEEGWRRQLGDLSK